MTAAVCMLKCYQSIAMGLAMELSKDAMAALRMMARLERDGVPERYRGAGQGNFRLLTLMAQRGTIAMRRPEGRRGILVELGDAGMIAPADVSGSAWRLTAEGREAAGDPPQSGRSFQRDYAESLARRRTAAAAD